MSLHLITVLLLLLYIQVSLSVCFSMLFSMYVKPVSTFIDSHLQLQMPAPPDKISELLHSMQPCISDVKSWSTSNRLKHNDNKTELVLVTSKKN